MQMKLIFGVAAFRALTRSVESKAFHNVGLWPVDYCFVNTFIDKRGSSPKKDLKSGQDLINDVKQAVCSGESVWTIFETINDVVAKASSKAAVIDSLFNQREKAI